MMRRALTLAALLLAACPDTGANGSGGGVGGGEGGGGGGGGGAPDAGQPQTCLPCAVGADCESTAACTQYSGDSFCAKSCATAGECAATEDCVLASDFGGTQVRVCLPKTGSCTPDAGCGVCPTGTACDLTEGVCESIVDAGAGTADAGRCGSKVPPATSSCCHACNVSSPTCQPNGCYGGWWCDDSNPAACSCKSPPTSCGAPADAGFTDAGTADAGTFDAGLPGDGGFIGPNGGTVARLYFAVVGDTRPATPASPVANYPTAVITKIYSDIAALSPRPQFVVGTGDYQFSNTSTMDAAAQLALYKTARNQYPGSLFAALGNHECTTATASNCVGTFAHNNFDAFMAALIAPLGKTVPYYSVPIQTSAGEARVIVTACNAWDAAQKTWLQAELSSSAVFKIVVRHEAFSTDAPCTVEMNPMLTATPYSLLLVGHTHLFSHTGRQLIVGMGGAPITGSTPFGFITVEQLAAGGWRVVQYDSTTSMQVTSFTIP